VSTPLIVPEDGRTELAVTKAPQGSADAARAPSPSRHRFSGLVGLGLILLIVLYTLYLARRYMM
jgi:hypothetical protein